MPTDWQRVSGIVQQGHGIASGQAADSPYPESSIQLQQPHFQALGLDLSPYFLGTLNISIAPHQFVMQSPAYTFPLVRWTERHPPETFSFSPCQIEFGGQSYEALVYYPHPETKERHFQNPSILEILAPRIGGIEYGDRVVLGLNSAEILIR